MQAIADLFQFYRTNTNSITNYNFRLYEAQNKHFRHSIKTVKQKKATVNTDCPNK